MMMNAPIRERLRTCLDLDMAQNGAVAKPDITIAEFVLPVDYLRRGISGQPRRSDNTRFAVLVSPFPTTNVTEQSSSSDPTFAS